MSVAQPARVPILSPRQRQHLVHHAKVGLRKAPQWRFLVCVLEGAIPERLSRGDEA